MIPPDWKLGSYYFELPSSLIAQYPAEQRDHSRMMVLSRESKKVSHDYFYQIVDWLPEDIALVLNNTKVIPTRLVGQRSSGGNLEAQLLRERTPGQWEVLIKRAKRIRPGESLSFCSSYIPAKAIRRLPEGTWVLEFEHHETLMSRLEQHAYSPLPPYIDRAQTLNSDKVLDRVRYQTCYARQPGAVAAPTAGLHFTPEILKKIEQKGIPLIEVTLHVGLGTFAPLRAQDIREHEIHDEYFEINAANQLRLRHARENKRKLVAVGTTCVRILETLARDENISSGWTKLYIYPPFNFKWVQGLLTNFHLPDSTLILLVAAFYGREPLMNAYQMAIAKQYRFYSYGDCMLIL